MYDCSTPAWVGLAWKGVRILIWLGINLSAVTQHDQTRTLEKERGRKPFIVDFMFFLSLCRRKLLFLYSETIFDGCERVNEYKQKIVYPTRKTGQMSMVAEEIYELEKD